MTLDLRNLRCAISAAETGSFRRAAGALDLPQSSVSRRIQLLERRLGFSLFERSRAGVRLTPAGAAFLENASAGTRQLEFAARYAVSVHCGQRGDIRIGISPWRTGGLLREVLRHFRSQFPRISISLTEISPMEVRHTVAMGDLDIAFVTRTGELSGCETKVLWREAIVVVMPETHRLAKRENRDASQENVATIPNQWTVTTPDTAGQTSSARRYVPPTPARRPRDRPLSALAPSARCHGIAPGTVTDGMVRQLG